MSYIFFFFFLMIRRPPRSTQRTTLFPYTTLFRSSRGSCSRHERRPVSASLAERLVAGDPQIGRAHVSTPVTVRYLVCRLLLEKKKKKNNGGILSHANSTKIRTTEIASTT